MKLTISLGKVTFKCNRYRCFGVSTGCYLNRESFPHNGSVGPLSTDFSQVPFSLCLIQNPITSAIVVRKAPAANGHLCRKIKIRRSPVDYVCPHPVYCVQPHTVHISPYQKCIYVCVSMHVCPQTMCACIYQTSVSQECFLYYNWPQRRLRNN